MNKTNVLVILSAIAALTSAGCAGNDKEVSYKSGGMTHTFSEGQGSVPKDFPLPIYPQASTTGSVSTESDQPADESKFLILSSEDPYDKVGDFYKKELASGGWKIETVQTLPKLINIAATKGAYDANIMLSSEGAKTTINLAISKTAGTEVPTPSAEQYLPDKLTPPTD